MSRSLKIAKMQNRNGVRGVFIRSEVTGEVRWIRDPGELAPEGWRAATAEELGHIKEEILAWQEESN